MTQILNNYSLEADEFKKRLLSDKEAVLIDVRTEGEFSKGHLKNSLNIPLDALAHHLPIKKIDKDRNIFVYCLSGSRSAIAVGVLSNLGYKKLHNLKNGLLGWRVLGFEEA